MQDLILGFRSLRASPGYSLVVVLTVGLGIAATTTIVSFMSPYLIRDLPFEDPERLVQLGQVDPVGGWDSARLSLPMFRDWEQRTRSFEDLGTYYYAAKNVTGAEGPERIIAGVLSPNLFGVLGVEADLGRTFGPGDEGVVLLDHGLWLRLIASMLYGIGPFDLLTFVTVTAVFLATAILATLLPAGRAARTNPIVVLRYE